VIGDNPGQNKRDAADDEGVLTLEEGEFVDLLDESGIER